MHKCYFNRFVDEVGARKPLKHFRSHIDASHSRQPLLKGERLVRYEVNAVISSCRLVNHIMIFLTQMCSATLYKTKHLMQQNAHCLVSVGMHTSALAIRMSWPRAAIGQGFCDAHSNMQNSIFQRRNIQINKASKHVHAVTFVGAYAPQKLRQSH